MRSFGGDVTLDVGGESGEALVASPNGTRRGASKKDNSRSYCWRSHKQPSLSVHASHMLASGDQQKRQAAEPVGSDA
jgi:hypothetical protein